MEEYEGYVVISKGEHSCIGFNPEASKEFVCWLYGYDRECVHSGFYSNDIDEILEKFRDRECAYL